MLCFCLLAGPPPKKEPKHIHSFSASGFPFCTAGKKTKSPRGSQTREDLGPEALQRLNAGISACRLGAAWQAPSAERRRRAASAWGRRSVPKSLGELLLLFFLGALRAIYFWGFQSRAAILQRFLFYLNVAREPRNPVVRPLASFGRGLGKKKQLREKGALPPNNQLGARLHWLPIWTLNRAPSRAR